MVGKRIAGRYRLLEELPGDHAWLAEDEELARRVVVRRLEGEAETFELRARAVASLHHPHVAQLYDYVESEGSHYVVVEHLPGGSLADRIAAAGALPAEEAERVAREVAAALAYAHAEGVPHPNLTAASVQFDHDDRTKVSYFDADALAEPAAAPSSARDVRSFGLLVSAMLTGRVASEPPHEPLGAASPQLAEVAAASLSDDPRVRPADGAALLQLLGPPAPAPAPPREPETLVIPPPAASRRSRRAPLLLAALIGLALLVVGAFAAVLTDGASDDAPPSTVPVSSAGSSTAAPASTGPLPATEPTTSSEQTTTEQTTAPPTTTQPTTPATPPTTVPEPTTEPEPPPPTDATTVEPPPAPTVVTETTIGVTTPVP